MARASSRLLRACLPSGGTNGSPEVAVLGWTYAALARRIVTGRPIPGLLVLATLGISVRTVIYLLSGNDFVYFFQPIMRTVATPAMWRAGSRIAGRVSESPAGRPRPRRGGVGPGVVTMGFGGGG